MAKAEESSKGMKIMNIVFIIFLVDCMLTCIFIIILSSFSNVHMQVDVWVKT